MLNTAVDELDLTPKEEAAVRERLWPLPLDGRPVGLMEDPSRQLRMMQQVYSGSQFNHEIPTTAAGNPDLDALYYTDKRDEWEKMLQENAPDDGWRLVILDPASRFIGPDVEKDNAAATRFVELLESWKNEPALADDDGVGPTILLSHHVNKRSADDPIEMLYKQGAARGSSALTDGVRWQLNMNFGHAEDPDVPGELTEFVVMRAAKSNHGRKGDVTWMTRGDGGVLHHYDGPEAQLMGPSEVADQQQNRDGQRGGSNGLDEKDQREKKVLG
jgi:hypothetical protein